MTHDHRKLAIEFNQRTWELLDRKCRTPDEAEEMIISAYASLAHWFKAGTGVHHQRGEWLLARVHAELGRLEPARHHLRRTQDLADFDIAFLEARVHALAEDQELARRHDVKAQSLGEAPSGAEDRKVFFDQLAEAPWFEFTA